jgi:hypothetical protein
MPGVHAPDVELRWALREDRAPLKRPPHAGRIGDFPACAQQRRDLASARGGLVACHSRHRVIVEERIRHQSADRVTDQPALEHRARADPQSLFGPMERIGIGRQRAHRPHVIAVERHARGDQLRQDHRFRLWGELQGRRERKSHRGARRDDRVDTAQTTDGGLSRLDRRAPSLRSTLGLDQRAPGVMMRFDQQGHRPRGLERRVEPPHMPRAAKPRAHVEIADGGLGSSAVGWFSRQQTCEPRLRSVATRHAATVTRDLVRAAVAPHLGDRDGVPAG